MADESRAPTAQGQPEQESTGEHARGNHPAAQIERNALAYFRAFRLDVLPGLVLHYIRKEARTLEANRQPNRFTQYDDFLRDYVTALTQRDQHNRYDGLTATHFENVEEFLGRPGIVLQWHAYADECNLVNDNRFQPMANVYARGGEDDTDIGEAAESMRVYFETYLARAKVLVDAWRQGDPLPQQEGAGELGLHGYDSFDVRDSHDLPQLVKVLGEVLRPPPTDNLNVLNMRDGQFPINQPEQPEDD